MYFKIEFFKTNVQLFYRSKAKSVLFSPLLPSDKKEDTVNKQKVQLHDTKRAKKRNKNQQQQQKKNLKQNKKKKICY